MPRTCTVCSHPERAQIDSAFVAGASYRSIAKQFGCSEAAMYRHTAEHIAQSIKQSQEAKEEAQALDVVAQLKEINTVSLEILKKARADEDRHELALRAIDRIQKQLELQAKLLGDIDTPQVNISISPEWLNMRSLIVKTLAPFPDARLAVAHALSQLEEQHARLN